MAERMGFEPMKGLLLYTLSKRALSTTQPSLLNILNILNIIDFKTGVVVFLINFLLEIYNKL